MYAKSGGDEGAKIHVNGATRHTSLRMLESSMVTTTLVKYKVKISESKYLIGRERA